MKKIYGGGGKEADVSSGYSPAVNSHQPGLAYSITEHNPCPPPLSLKQSTFSYHPSLLEEYENRIARDLCKTTAMLSLKINLKTDQKYWHKRPNPCNERNCPKCYPERITKIKHKLNPLFRSIPENQRLTHLILTMSEVPVRDMNENTKKTTRTNLRKFFNYLSSKNVWGFGVVEFKYYPDKQKYNPHAHLMVFGWLPAGNEMSRVWDAINDKHQTIKIKRPPKTRERRIKRKFKMLDYFARRCAGAGLIMKRMLNKKTGICQEVAIGSMPVKDYLMLVKGSKLFITFGKRHKYTDDKGQIHCSNIPQDILQEWRLRIEAEAELASLYEICPVAIIKNDDSPWDKSIPPPGCPSTDELEAVINREGYTGLRRYALAYQDIVKMPVKSGSLSTESYQKLTKPKVIKSGSFSTESSSLTSSNCSICGNFFIHDKHEVHECCEKCALESCIRGAG